MIHADSVRQWETESNDLRSIIGNQRREIERLTRERDRYKAALQSIICNKAIEGEALLHQAIARDALEQSVHENPQVKTPSAFEHTPGTGSVR